MMVVSMLQCIIEYPGLESKKEKRRIVNSIKQRLASKFHVSVAEVDLSESRQFVQLGFAYVCNQRSVGEAVMQKIIDYLENAALGRIHDFQIHSESYP